MGETATCPRPYGGGTKGILMVGALQMFGGSDGWDHIGGWAWGWMVLAWVAFFAIIFYAVRVASNGSQRRATATEILAERFARGEISIEEYEERRAVLKRKASSR